MVKKKNIIFSFKFNFNKQYNEILMNILFNG